MTPDQLKRLEDPAKNFIQATLDEGRGFCAIRFQNAVAVVVHDRTPGSKSFAAAIAALAAENLDTTKLGDMEFPR